jgi:hypothetical protein
MRNDAAPGIRLKRPCGGKISLDTDRTECQMMESTEFEATEEGSADEASVDEALTELSAVAESSANELIGLNEDLAEIRGRREHGWSWRRIISDSAGPRPLTSLSKVAADIARASGAFRRALAVGLRDEGMQVTEIAKLFEVSRQRVSALLRVRGAAEPPESFPHESLE